MAVEIAGHRLSAASVAVRDSTLSVTSHAVETLQPGAVVPSLNATNIADPKAVAAALRRVFERMGSRPKRVALAIPDSVAKVSLLKFEKVPPRARDLDELVRWQVRKAAPFRIEDAQLRNAFSAEVAAHVVGSPSVFGLEATLAALTQGDDWLAALIDYLRGNRDFVEKNIGLPMARVEATYLAWIDCEGLNDAAELFLKHGVSVYPGSQFGEPRFVRLNFGTQRKVLEEAIRRIKSASTPNPRG